MQNPYNEDLVEHSAIELLEELGWNHRNCFDEFNQGRSSLGRENKGEVVLTTKLRSALQRLNPDASNPAIDDAIEQLTRSRAVMSPAEANCKIYRLLKDGVNVTITDPDDDVETDETLKVIDWDNPENNDFFLATQFWIAGDMYNKRPDAIGFINGLPLVLMEFKRMGEDLYTAFDGNIRDYKSAIPQLFWYNALIILSNGLESRIGSLTAEWEHFAKWKKVESEDEPGEVLLETILRGICHHRRLLDIIENFTLFMDAQDGLIKLIAKNHQFLGVNNTIQALQARESNQGKLGVFWHTQGSGKSISMIFFAQKVLRKIPGGWRFVIVTDRNELDKQIYKNFADCRGVITQPEVHAEDIQHLQQLLSEDHRYVFTLIQKFQTNHDAPHTVLSDNSKVIVITDESHRSQYHTFALNMRTALRNAAFIAFTGTPLITSEEERTRQVFGEYVSKYNFKQSVDDGATVPLYYENRFHEMESVNEQLNEDFEWILKAAALDETQEDRIKWEFAKQYQVITREKRLKAIAEDIVSHFMGRGHRGKAMVISIDKATAVKMYDKVKEHWKCYRERLESELRDAPDRERETLEADIQFMKQTDMAVVVSPSPNEISNLEARGVDITPHRQRMNAQDLDAKFKKPEDPFRIVFVCAMWMTGFDVPACSTIYLDKPQRGHTLMQTIARANRVFGDKVNGLIVDYIGISQNLEEALATYADGTDPEGRIPIQDKSELVEKLRSSIADINERCANLDVDLPQIVAETEQLEQIRLIAGAVDRILANDKSKQSYLQRASQIFRLHKAILPDPAANEFGRICFLINTIANTITQKIRPLTPSADISDVTQAIEDLLDRSIVPTSYTIDANPEPQPVVNLSEIDFDQLRERFRTQYRYIEVERLRTSISRQLSEMVRRNRTRMNYQERFEQIIAEYNEAAMSADGINVDEWFEQLIALANELVEEGYRAVTEQLSEEELAVFDLLTQPEINLTQAEKEEVKAISKELLIKLKQEKLFLDWRNTQQARAGVKVTINRTLEILPECYTDVMYDQKREAVYQHIYDSYSGAGNSIYSPAP